MKVVLKRLQSGIEKLNPNGSDSDLRENQIEHEISTSKSEEVLPYENGRFQSRNCNQTLSAKKHFKRHEKKSCKGVSSNQQKRT